LGTSKRYAASVDAAMSDRIAERIASSGPLQTLTADELRLDSEPLTIDPHPKPVRAWVRFGGAALLVRGEACRWTSRAVGIRFRIRDRDYRCWVWSSAVESDS
jgi:hypothetical protein